MTTDAPVISLDTETYGACEQALDGSRLPDQRYFHPARCLWQDKVPLNQLIQVVTITLPEFDPRSSPGAPWTVAEIAKLRPGVTMALFPSVPHHVTILNAFLQHADTILGMNLLFDIPMLRAVPVFRGHLGGRHTLIDLAHINYLHNELRPEKSLKALGPVLQQFSYRQTLKDENGNFRKFKRISDKEALEYACQDPHNTMLAASELARRIVEEYPGSAKLGSAVIDYYSNLSWSAVRMMESGTPMSIDMLLREEEELKKKAASAAALCLDHGLVVGADYGDAPVASKRAFLEPLARQLPSTYAQGLEYTKKKKELSLNDKNRLLITDYFESESPESDCLKVLAAWDTHTKAEKILSSYTFPLLRGSRKNPEAPALAKLWEHPCITLPCSQSCSHSSPLPSGSPSEATGRMPVRAPRLGLGFPRVYLTPSAFKDGQGDSGGQQQCRISFKDPAIQTFPAQIKKCLSSRYGSMGSILSWDASQVELRVAGLISGDNFILKAYHENRDLHTETALKTFGPDCAADPDFGKKYRQPAKHANFTKLNLGGASVLQKTLLKKAGIRVPLSFCEMMVAETPRVNPELHAWQMRTIAEVRKAGRMELPVLGQSRFFSPDEKPNEIVNFPIQGLAATLTNMVMIRVHQTMPNLNRRHPRWHMFVNWYDALFVDAHTSAVDEARGVVEGAIAWAISTYWADLQSHYGRECPMSYGFTHHTHEEAIA